MSTMDLFYANCEPRPATRRMSREQSLFRGRGAAVRGREFVVTNHPLRQ
jgi:hypothetical protein